MVEVTTLDALKLNHEKHILVKFYHKINKKPRKTTMVWRSQYKSAGCIATWKNDDAYFASVNETADKSNCQINVT